MALFHTDSTFKHTIYRLFSIFEFSFIPRTSTEMLFVTLIQLFPFVSVVLCSSDDSIVHRSPANEEGSVGTNFRWQDFIDWPSSPDTASKKTQPSVSIEHYAPEPSKHVPLLQDRDRKLKKAYNHQYYQLQRNDPQRWRNRLDSQKLNRYIKLRKEKARIASLSPEDKEAALKERKEKGKKRYLKDKARVTQQRMQADGSYGQVREVTPEAKKRRRAINLKAVQRHRKKLKERAKLEKKD